MRLTLVQLTVLWLLYYNRIHAAFYVALVLCALRLLSTEYMIVFQLSYVLLLTVCALVVNDDESAWYKQAFSTEGTVLIYVSNALQIIGTWLHVSGQVTCQTHLSRCFYWIRRGVLLTILHISFCISVYLCSQAIHVADTTKYTIEQTTIYSVQRCNFTATDSKVDEGIDRLYSTHSQHNNNCPWNIWVTNRLNILASTAIWVVYVFLFSVQHESMAVAPNRRTWYVILELLRCLCVFGAITIAVDDVHRWYVLSHTTATLLTVAFAIDLIKYVWFLRMQIPSKAYFSRDMLGFGQTNAGNR